MGCYLVWCAVRTLPKNMQPHVYLPVNLQLYIENFLEQKTSHNIIFIFMQASVHIYGGIFFSVLYLALVGRMAYILASIKKEDTKAASY